MTYSDTNNTEIEDISDQPLVDTNDALFTEKTDDDNIETSILKPKAIHKKIKPNTEPIEKTSVKNKRNKQNPKTEPAKVDDILEELNSTETVSTIEEMNETVIIPDKEPEIITDKELAEHISPGSGVVINNEKTYFERIYEKQELENSLKPVLSKTEEFKQNMIPKPVDDYDFLQTQLVSKTKRESKSTMNSLTIVPSEKERCDDELLASQESQYIIKALYIVDIENRKKYLQNSIISLPSDESQIPKIFLRSIKAGRIVKICEYKENISRNEVAYDTRSRKYVKKGTPEYQDWLQFIANRQQQEAKSNELRMKRERAKLGIE